MRCWLRDITKIQVPYSPNEIVEILRCLVADTAQFNGIHPKSSFSGIVNGDSSFNLKRDARLGGGFRPRLMGEIESINGKTWIKLEMKLGKIDASVVVLWTSMCVFAFAMAIIGAIVTGQGYLGMVGVGSALLMSLFGYTFALCCFWREVPKSKQAFLNAVDGKIEMERGSS